MFKKFSFWLVLILIASIGATVYVHWNTIHGLHQGSARVYTLYQREGILDSLTLSLERYRRLSASFRKLTSDELTTIKSKLKAAFEDGVNRLSRLEATPDERINAQKLNTQLTELLALGDHFEPMLFTKDAYLKPEVQALHEQILSSLTGLKKSAESRIRSLSGDASKTEAQAMMLLIAIGGAILALVLCMMIRNHFVYLRPLKKLAQYSNEIRSGKSIPKNPPHFTGMYAGIQTTLNELALNLETHMRDRHKFLLDIVADLKSPLRLLQASKDLQAGAPSQFRNEGVQIHSAEAVRRGLAIFSGSLEDLNDIVDINRLESRMEERTVDLSELISDVARTLLGFEFSKRVNISVPPIPLWMQLDVRRIERVLIHVISKIMDTLPSESETLSMSVIQSAQGSSRGVEIVIQDSDRSRNGRPIIGGPEQDILSHWISENGVSMTLAHKIIRAHGGTITASGVAGMSVKVTIRLPHERVVSRGLIAPPSQALGSHVAEESRAQGLTINTKVDSSKEKSSRSKL